MGESSEHIDSGQKRKASGSKKISRREFLKISALAAAGAAVAACDVDVGKVKVVKESEDGSTKAEKEAKQIKPNTQAPEKEKKENRFPVPQPEYIKGDRVEYETYGHTEPLNQEQVNALIVHLNKEFKKGGVEMKNNTYYSAEFIREKAYVGDDSIPKDTGRENYQAFIEAHDEALNEILAPAGIKQVTRRIIVVEEGVEVTGTWIQTDHIGTDKWMLGTDGSEGLWFPEPYNPTESAGYHDNVDEDRIHEKVHKVLHIYDLYCWDYYPKLQESTPSCFGDMPEEWWEYNQERRSDERNQGLMHRRQYDSISSYTKWLLTKREVQGYTHDLERTIPEYVGFPNEAADNNILVLGSEYDGADIEIWRSSGEESPETFNRTSFAKNVENGEVNIGNPFENVPLNEYKTVSGGDSLLLIKARLTSEEVRFRYIDLGDFSVGLGLENYPDTLKMRLNMANKNMKPEELDWKIGYEKVYE